MTHPPGARSGGCIVFCLGCAGMFGMCGILPRELYLALGGHAAEVEEGVAHTAKGRVDAHTRALGNLLERHLTVVAHDKHLALLGGEVLDEMPYVVADGGVAEDILHVAVAEVAVVEQVIVGIVGTDKRLGVFAAEMVDDNVMRYAEYPRTELAVSSIAALLNGHDNLYESLLKNIVGDIGVFDNAKYVVVDTQFVSFEKLIKRPVFALSKVSDQLVVGQPYEVLHCMNKFLMIGVELFNRQRLIW